MAISSATTSTASEKQSQDSDGDDSFDPYSLPTDRWLSQKEVIQWKAGVHQDQLSRRQKQADAFEQIKVMQKQLDISNSMVAFKHNREDKTTRLNLSNQIKLMDHQLDHRYRLALLVAQLVS